MTQCDEWSVLSSSYSSVRVSVYRTLELWLQVAGASANILQGSPGHSELLFSHLLGDITPGAEAVKVSTDLNIWDERLAQLDGLLKTPAEPVLHLCPFLQLRVGLSADVVPGGKPGPRRTKPLVIADTVGQALQRKGDIMANQDTCLSALRGEIPFVCHLERWCFSESVNVIDLFFFCTALRQVILTSGTLLKDDIHKVNITSSQSQHKKTNRNNSCKCIQHRTIIIDHVCLSCFSFPCIILSQCSCFSLSVSMMSYCRCVWGYSSSSPAAALHVNLQGASVGSTAVPSPDESYTGCGSPVTKNRLYRILQKMSRASLFRCRCILCIPCLMISLISFGLLCIF